MSEKKEEQKQEAPASGEKEVFGFGRIG